MKLSSMIGKLAGYVGSRFVGAAIGFASQILIARMLPQADVGVVFMGMSAAAFISLAAIGGYSMLAFTQLPKLLTLGRKTLVEAFHRVAIADSLTAGLVIVATLLLADLTLDLPPGQELALLMGCLCAPASALIRYNSSIATSIRQYELAYLPDFVIRPLMFLACLFLAFLLGMQLSVVVVLLLFIASTFIVALGQSLVLKGHGVASKFWREKRQSFARRLRSRATALTLVSAVALAFADIVTLLAGFVLPEADVAVVGVAVRLAAIAGFVLQAGQTFILPDYTQAILRREEKLANSLLLRINLTTLAVIAAAIIGALVLGSVVMSIFGPDYVRGTSLLLLFLAGQSIRSLGGMNQHILSLNGHQLRTAGACVLALVFLLMLTLLLTPRFGLMGIGYAVIATELVWMLALAAQAQKLCGRRGDLLWLMTQPR